MPEPLADHCLSVPGCDSPRLRYAGYCAAHGPLTPPLPEPRCLAPLRCYRPCCLVDLVPARCDLPQPERVREDIRGRDYRRHLAVVR